MHKLSGHLWMVHASDNRGQRDEHLPPGEGNIAWQRLVEQLARLHFTGTLILEIAAESTPEATLESARRASRFLRDLCRQV